MMIGFIIENSSIPGPINKIVEMTAPAIKPAAKTFCIKGSENQKAITEKLLDEFNLQHLRSLNASVLSGGEIRRLMMARVMINKPKIVLLDEPLAALDPLVIQDIQKYILKIQSSGTAILVTDHNVKNLFDITDRSYVLEQGITQDKWLEEGTYDVDQYPDVVEYTPGEDMGRLSRKLGNKGNVYGVDSELMRGVFYVDAGLVSGYTLPKHKSLVRGGFADEEVGDWMNMDKLVK